MSELRLDSVSRWVHEFTGQFGTAIVFTSLAPRINPLSSPKWTYASIEPLRVPKCEFIACRCRYLSRGVVPQWRVLPHQFSDFASPNLIHFFSDYFFKCHPAKKVVWVGDVRRQHAMGQFTVWADIGFSSLWARLQRIIDAGLLDFTDLFLLCILTCKRCWIHFLNYFSLVEKNCVDLDQILI